ncbi:TPA: hypothetical protein EYP70_05330 [Candidatus Bathyarchaeota archaeon]|nr:hypothetical protein [Candidatus Bathyarchaeota archaeon]
MAEDLAEFVEEIDFFPIEDSKGRMWDWISASYDFSEFRSVEEAVDYIVRDISPDPSARGMIKELEKGTFDKEISKAIERSRKQVGLEEWLE